MHIYASVSMLSMRNVRMKTSKSWESEGNLTSYLKVNVSLILWGLYDSVPEVNIQVAEMRYYFRELESKKYGGRIKSPDRLEVSETR